MECVPPDGRMIIPPIFLPLTNATTFLFCCCPKYMNCPKALCEIPPAKFNYHHKIILPRRRIKQYFFVFRVGELRLESKEVTALLSNLIVPTNYGIMRFYKSVNWVV